MKTLYLHIGLPRTGTSFLQSEIFPKLKQVNFMHPYSGVEKIKVLLRKKDSPTGNTENARNELLVSKEKNDRMRKLYGYVGQLSRSSNSLTDRECKQIQSIASELSRNINLISDESLIDFHYKGNNKKQYDILRDIKKAFANFNIKIILGIREQSSIILSLYKHYLHSGGTKNLKDFLSWISNDNFSIEETFFKTFEYSSHIDEIIRLFGENNLYIYIFENLKEDREEFLKNLLNFLGEKEVPEFNKDKIYNRGYGTNQMKIARVVNRFFKTEFNPKGILPVFRLPIGCTANPRLLLQRRFVQKLIYRDYKMPHEIKRKIKSMYLEDNKKIDREYGLNLPDNYF